MVFASYSCRYSSSDEHSLESSLYPQRAPPQSSLTLSPDRVMPYRSHVQHVLPDETLDGDELFVERDVRDGTSESLSESMYDEPVDETDEAGEIVWRAKRLLSASSVALSYWVLMT